MHLYEEGVLPLVDDHPAPPPLVTLLHQQFAGITKNLVQMRESARRHVLFRKTSRPATNGDKAGQVLSRLLYVIDPSTKLRSIHAPLQQPYNGPYEVVKCNSKHFTVIINGHNQVISVDRLKPAHLDTSATQTNETVNTTTPIDTSTSTQTPPVLAPATRISRSGRWPTRLKI